MLQQRLEQIRQRIQQACARAGRSPESVTLVAVTKGVPIEAMREAIALGVRDIGENRVQESSAKQLALGSGLRAVGPEPRAQNPQRIRWHLIGHLQRNKVAHAVELFDVIHSVDSSELAAALDRHAATRTQGSRPGAQSSARRIEAFIQVNVAGEATKFGCAPDDVSKLADTIRSLPHVQLRGLMTIAPYADDPETVRPVFRQLRELRDDVTRHFRQGHSTTPPLLLSMGMSHDFEVAIEEGADVVRVGTAIFGSGEVMSGEMAQ